MKHVVEIYSYKMVVFNFSTDHNVLSISILEYKGPPSGASSAKQSPALQHRAMGQRSALQDERWGSELTIESLLLY